MKILMVCLGNICRSPIAEGVMGQKAKAHGLDWEVASAGTGSYHIGSAPHQHSQEICKLHGVDIAGQRAQQFSKSDLVTYDKIYAMDTSVYSDLMHIAKHTPHADKLMLFLDELGEAKEQSVPDPYYGGKEGYTHVYELIDRTCDKIIDKYNK
ncbi:MAG: low molecular weight protein-tyrosine-phosphatase [Flavipsychrobacter sp.]